jgi:hypothetical protein
MDSGSEQRFDPGTGSAICGGKIDEYMSGIFAEQLGKILHGMQGISI